MLDHLAQISIGRVPLRNNGADDMAANDLFLTEAKKMFGKFIEKGHGAVTVHAEDNGVGILHQLAILVLTCEHGLFCFGPFQNFLFQMAGAALYSVA